MQNKKLSIGVVRIFSGSKQLGFAGFADVVWGKTALC